MLGVVCVVSSGPANVVLRQLIILYFPFFVLVLYLRVGACFVLAPRDRKNLVSRDKYSDFHFRRCAAIAFTRGIQRLSGPNVVRGLGPPVILDARPVVGGSRRRREKGSLRPENVAIIFAHPFRSAALEGFKG